MIRVAAALLAAVVFGCAAAPPPAPAHQPRRGWIRQSGGRVAVVFIHGFVGDEKTWFLSGDGKFWPQLMKDDRAFDGADLYVAAYPTSFGQRYFYPAMAADALQFQLDPILKTYDRIGFVVHSMGGLVVREYLLDRRVEAAGKVAFISYFATPGKGSDVATIAKYFVPSLAVDQMDPQAGEPYLVELHNDWVRSDFVDVPAYCAAETLRTGPFVIVRPESVIGVCARNEILGIDANHLDIVKPRGTGDPPYQLVAKAFAEQFGRLAPPPRAQSRPAAAWTLAFSADGTMDAVVEDGTRLFVRDRQTDALRPIASSNGDPIWWAAFSGGELYWVTSPAQPGRGQRGPLYRASVGNPQPEVVTALGFLDAVAISPDGQELAVVRWDFETSSWKNPRLSILDRRGVEKHRLPLPDLGSQGHISWSVNGEIAIPDRHRIRVVSRRTMQIVDWPFDGIVEHVTWQPAGDWLVAGARQFVSQAVHLWRVERGQPPIQLTKDRAAYLDVHFAGSDLFTHRRVELTELWVADMSAGGTPRRVATNAYTATDGYRLAWTGDERIVFASYVPDAGPRRGIYDVPIDLVIVDPVTLRKERLTRSSTEALDPVVLRDGKTVLFRCFRKTGALCRQVIGEPSDEVVPGVPLNLHVAPNGIAWSVTDDGGIRVCRSDGDPSMVTRCNTFPSLGARHGISYAKPISELEVLYSGLMGTDLLLLRTGQPPVKIGQCSVQDADLSPDGSRLVADCGDGDAVLDIRTGTILHRFSEQLREPRWSPDGKRIAWATVLRGDDNREFIRVANADGSNAIDVGSAEGFRSIGMPQWSRSGRYLAYTTRQFRVEPHYVRDVE